MRDPSLRSGWRRGAQTPRKRRHFEDGAVWADGEPFPAEIVTGAPTAARRIASKGTGASKKTGASKGTGASRGTGRP